MTKNKPVLSAAEIRIHLDDSLQGRSGRNVYALTNDGLWLRICQVRTRAHVVQAQSMSTGRWFTVQDWREA